MAAAGLFVALALTMTVAVPAARASVLDDIASFFSGMFGVSAQADLPDGATTAVDPDTTDSWMDLISRSTENVGRIWTDKTVTDADDGEFNVSLSALSSTSNLSSTSTTPLDIVLVLDSSGSMKQKMISYEAAYGIPASGRWNGSGEQWGQDGYYIYDANGQQVHVQWKRKSGSGLTAVYAWRDSENDVWYTPKTSANDTDPTHVQFYKAVTSNVTKLQALKTAVNSFIDSVATQNAALSDTAQKHNLSIIDYDSSAKVVQDLQTVTNDNKQSFKNKVDSEVASGGATASDKGLEAAKTQLTQHGRVGSKKAVIFFTDGEPNHQNGFWGNVAADAINAASNLKKDLDATVYSIGVFGGANPSDTTTPFNKYMNAVSSNYPEATARSNGSGTSSTWSCTLGDRAKGDHYFAASNSHELSRVFSSISEEINEGTGSPTVTNDEDGAASGYITFTDKLGDYMEVGNFTSVVYAGQTFNTVSSSTQGNTTTYTFTGETPGNGVYESGDLSNIKITVTKSGADDAKTGDTVTVQIPAQLIPLRQFNVDTDDDTMTVTHVDPIKVNYTVGLKADFKGKLAENLADPDDALKAYIKANTSADGSSVYFYSNAYTKVNGADNGDTTAGFEPAKGNSFYYFTADTPLYKDEACKIPLTDRQPDSTATYYYPRTFYTLEGDKTAKENQTIQSVSGRIFDQAEGTVWGRNDDNQVFIKAGTARTVRVNDTRLQKTSNTTVTAGLVNNPTWADQGVWSQIDTYLGNNGRVAVELPGMLTVTKTATAAEGLTVTDDFLNGKDFTFALGLTDKGGNALAADKTFKAQVFAKDGTTKVGDEFTVNNGSTFTLKNGETLRVYGLAAGTQYTVTEDASAGKMPAGFEQTDKKNDTGTITANAVSAASFTNTYKVSEATLDGAKNLKVTKELTGRDWQDGDEFSFKLAADENDAATKAALDAKNIVLPDNAESITIKNDTANHQAAFGDITFKQAGTFKFTITEEQGSLGGITYDTTPKTVTVKVKDQGDGTLKAEATEGANPTITNTYGTVVPDDEAAKTDVKFTKEFNGWSDAGGAFDNTNFSFTLKAVTEGAPLPQKNGANNTTAMVSKPASGTSATFSFGAINFTYDMVKDAQNKTKTFTYEVTEDVPQGADSGKLNGITYDTGKATVKITVTDKNGNGQMGVTVNVDKTQFTNTYQAEQVTVDANGALAGTKVLTAVNSDKKLAANEFSFTAKPIDNTTVAPTATTATNEAPTTAGSNTGAFNFGSLTFDAPGTYTYKVTEDVPQDAQGGKLNGYTYDGSVYTVTFTVTDNKQGKLEAARTITKDGAPKDSIVFTNSYEPTPVSSDTAGVLGGKKIVQASEGNSYTLRAGDFSFRLTPGAGASGDAQTVQNEADGSYAFDPIQFTSAGTYSYTVSEVQATKGGFTFDGASYGVTFTVEDQNGTLKITDTKVQRVEGDNTTDVTLGRLDFTNKYDPKATSYTLTGTKVLESTDSSAQRSLKDGEFTFQLTPVGGTAGDVQKTTNAATGAFSFGTLNYTAPGTYTYEVRELAGKDSTITYDTNTVYTVAVTVKDQDGMLTVTNVTGVPAGGIVFKNTYTPTPVTVDPTAGDTKIGGTKTLTGRDAKAGEFTYELLDDSGTVVDTATSGDAKDGEAATWTFGKKLEFTKTGTYRYTVREASGGTTAAGVTYDAATFGVTITVTEDAVAHALVAQVTTTKDGAKAPITFANSYAAAPATVGFKAGKVLTGKDLTAGQFSFKLTGSGVNLTAKNDADGGVDFGTLTFKQAGTYTYQVSEVDDKQANVTYDDTAYKVVVTVTDPGTGQLQAQVTYDNDAAPVFQNSYAEPPKDDGKTDEQPPQKKQPKDEVKKEQLPKTSDDTMVGIVASVVAAIGAIGAGAALRLKGRR